MRRSNPTTLVVCAGTSIFAYYPYVPGPFLSQRTSLIAITSDPAEAARAQVGDAIVADVRLTLEALLAEVRPATGPRPQARAAPPETDGSLPLSPAAVYATLKQVLPGDAIVVLESPSSTAALRNQLRVGRPDSYYFGAGGGLGFGLSAAIGVQLAQPERPVVCVVGEGSAQYAITAFWTAAAYQLPVTFLVTRNDEYGILKWFAELEAVSGVPGLDLPGLDVCATAASYGVPGVRVDGGAEELDAALTRALAEPIPSLIEVPVAPGMALA